MKLHDLQPAEGSRKERIRVGRGIAAGKGKTAGRGTKGQKARAGGSIPPWFEGGQTPLHMRIPKLRGFKNRFRVEYEVVNVGAIDALVARGAFEAAETPAKKGTKRGDKTAGGQITVNQDILRAVGLVRTLNKPLKILGAGELTVPLFVVADAFTASARTKIEAAGGVVNVLEMPTEPLAALGVDVAPAEPKAKAGSTAKPEARIEAEAAAEPEVETDRGSSETAADAADAPAAKPAKARKAAPKAEAAAEPVEATADADADAPAGDEAPPAEPETTEPSADLNA